MKYTFTALALAALSSASPVPAEPSGPPSFKISNVISGGSGCPQGSIDVNYSDSAILPIYFNKEFTATVGTNVPSDQSRKNCQLGISIDRTPGWQFAVLGADYSGWGDLDSGVKGIAKSTYYFAGSTSQVSTKIDVVGPFTGRYSRHDDVAIFWSPCGDESILNVNSEIALTPLGKGAGTLVATKESARFTHSVYLKWQKC